jgi:hypothetical protein
MRKLISGMKVSFADEIERPWCRTHQRPLNNSSRRLHADGAEAKRATRSGAEPRK